MLSIKYVVLLKQVSQRQTLHTGKDLADQLPTTPRIIKTHFPVQFVPRSFWEQNCKVKTTCEVYAL